VHWYQPLSMERLPNKQITKRQRFIKSAIHRSIEKIKKRGTCGDLKKLVNPARLYEVIMTQSEELSCVAICEKNLQISLLAQFQVVWARCSVYFLNFLINKYGFCLIILLFTACIEQVVIRSTLVALSTIRSVMEKVLVAPSLHVCTVCNTS